MSQNLERKKRARIVIYVSGGVVQDILADAEGIEAMVVDYDSEKSGEPRCARGFAAVPVDRAYIRRTIRHVED